MATLTEPQHIQALNLANRIRLARADLKRQVRAGNVSLSEALNHPDVGNMSVSELLQAQHRWGQGRTRKFLSSNGIGENRTIGRMTDRQKDLVAQGVERIEALTARRRVS